MLMLGSSGYRVCSADPLRGAPLRFSVSGSKPPSLPCLMDASFSFSAAWACTYHTDASLPPFTNSFLRDTRLQPLSPTNLLLQSTSDYIKNTFVIRDMWATAVQLDPSDANAQHLLGRWHHGVASMSWMTRKVASTLFAEPPTATYEEALALFIRAEETDPGFWKANRWMLAETYKALGKTAEAAEWAKKAVEMPLKGTYDMDAHEKSLALLKGLDRPAYDDYMARHPDGGMKTFK